MNAYAVQDAWKKHENAVAGQRVRESAALFDQVEVFVADRFPELVGDPYAFMAVLHCRERGLPASLVPDVRDQLAERADA